MEITVHLFLINMKNMLRAKQKSSFLDWYKTVTEADHKSVFYTNLAFLEINIIPEAHIGTEDATPLQLIGSTKTSNAFCASCKPLQFEEAKNPIDFCFSVTIIKRQEWLKTLPITLTCQHTLLILWSGSLSRGDAFSSWNKLFILISGGGLEFHSNFRRFALKKKIVLSLPKPTHKNNIPNQKCFKQLQYFAQDKPMTEAWSLLELAQSVHSWQKTLHVF